MPPAQWALSTFFVAFVAAQALVGAGRVEEWPLTTMPMFAQYFEPEQVPVRISLVATMPDGLRRELAAAEFGLTDNELRNRLYFTPDLRAACGELGRAYNAGRPLAQQLSRLVAHREAIARPGIPRPPSTEDYRCPLVPPPPGR